MFLLPTMFLLFSQSRETMFFEKKSRMLPHPMSQLIHTPGGRTDAQPNLPPASSYCSGGARLGSVGGVSIFTNQLRQQDSL